MELKFLGRGAAFNPKEGSNAAYFVDNNELFMLDCGESTFAAALRAGVLRPSLAAVNILITHTHSDHVGSLGSLVFWVYFTMGKKPRLMLPPATELEADVKELLRLYGVTQDMYCPISISNKDDSQAFTKYWLESNGQYSSFSRFAYVRTPHCPELESYSFLFLHNNKLTVYTGDLCDPGFIRRIFENDKYTISRLYVEVTTADYEGNVHLNIDKLREIVPRGLEERIYCMHLNNDECIKRATEYGFRVVEVG